MPKILIFGNSGSGKSTLAKELAKESVGAEGLAHLDLDNLAWRPVTPPERAPLEVSRRKIEDFTGARDTWVIEGCYTDLLELLRPQASEIIFMDLPVARCVENAKSRPWEPHKYDSKEAQDKNLAMLIGWIEQYDTRPGVFSHAAHRAFYENFAGKKTLYKSNDRTL